MQQPTVTTTEFAEKSADEATAELKLSVIIPLHNEDEVISVCHQRVMSVLATLAINSEIIYIDDVSTAHIPI